MPDLRRRLSLVPPAKREATRGRRGERADTLIEVLCAVVLMGVGMLVIITALLTVTVNAQTNKQKTQVASFLQKWSDAVTAPRTSSGTQNYTECTMPLGADIAMTPAERARIGLVASYKVEYLNAPVNGQPTWSAIPSAFGLIRDTRLGTGDFGIACFGSGTRGIQKVTLYASMSGKHPVNDSIVIYRRRTDCPTNYSNADRGPC